MRIVAWIMAFTVDTGTLLSGRYRLLERIGVGGQGEVWRAADTTLKRSAAVKVLRGEGPEFRDRFRREARNAAALSHPNVAQVFDYGEGHDGEPPYLVMEYVNGEPLSATIAREAPLPTDRALAIIAAAASALAVAHAAGLVHRDVKPGNLLIARDGSVKITDFGIARALDSVPLTHTGTLLGTPQYLAPEQAFGRPATPASDLYALGVIAFEMLTGRPPYEGPPAAVLVAHRDSPLPPLPWSVPPGLGELVRALTAKDPAMRPDGAAAVAEWATRLRADPTAATALAPPVNGTNSMRTRPPTDRSTRVLAQPPLPPAPARRWRALPLVLGGLVIALAAGLVGWFARPAATNQPPTPPRPAVTSSSVVRPRPPGGLRRPPGHRPVLRQKGNKHGKHHKG